MNSIRHRLRSIYKGFLRREKIHVFERVLDSSCSKIKANIEVKVRFSLHEDFARISQRFKKFDAVAEDRFRRGHLCLVANAGENVVHLEWVAFDEAYASELERELRIDSGSAYIYDTYTVREYRGLGIAPEVMSEAFSHLYVKGIRRVYTCVPHDNLPSIRAMEKAGFRWIGTVTFTRILSLRLYQCRGKTEQDYFRLKNMFAL